jgi:hypothetical protein
MENPSWPPHLDALSPCFHCGSKEWRWHGLDKIWVCRCYFEPALRKPWEARYGKEVAQQAMLPMADFVLPGKRGK